MILFWITHSENAAVLQRTTAFTAGDFADFTI